LSPQPRKPIGQLAAFRFNLQQRKASDGKIALHIHLFARTWKNHRKKM